MSVPNESQYGANVITLPPLGQTANTPPVPYTTHPGPRFPASDSKQIPNPEASISNDRSEAMVTSEKYTDVKVEAAHARTDAKLAELMGRIDIGHAALKSEIEKVGIRSQHIEQSTQGVKGTIIITSLALLGALIAILAYGQQWFGIGVTTRDIIQSTVKEERQQQLRDGSQRIPELAPPQTSAPQTSPPSASQVHPEAPKSSP